MRGWWAQLLSWWWVYWGLVFRSFGNAFGRRGAYQRAVACFSRALRHTPEDAGLYSWRGTLYWRELGEQEQAEADLTRAIELAPEIARAHLNRALVRWYAVSPDRAGAAQDFRTYLERDSDPYWCAVAREHLQQLETS